MRYGPICLIALLSLLAPARADELKGIKLYQQCSNTNQDSVGYLNCNAYVAGFVEGLYIGKSLPGSGYNFCPPKDLTYLQARLVIEKFMRDHPKMLNDAAGSVAMAVRVLTYPCAK